MPRERLNNLKKNQEYGFLSVPFFGEDKHELIQVLTDSEAPYASLAHFIRAAINTELEKLKLDFRITER